MTTRARSGSRVHTYAAAVLIAAGVALGGCTEVETADVEGYQPAQLHEVEGSEIKRVTLTAEGVRRTDVRTATVDASGRRRVVPYSALIYDGEGHAHVYVTARPMSFMRTAVVVDGIAGDRALLSDGPPVGARVVTTGAAELYGAELEIGGSH